MVCQESDKGCDRKWEEVTGRSLQGTNINRLGKEGRGVESLSEMGKLV